MCESEGDSTQSRATPQFQKGATVVVLSFSKSITQLIHKMRQTNLRVPHRAPHVPNVLGIDQVVWQMEEGKGSLWEELDVRVVADQFVVERGESKHGCRKNKKQKVGKREKDAKSTLEEG